MAEFQWFGTEQDPCPWSATTGCEHAIGVHSDRTDGCSYMGSSGWCECTFVPERSGAAALLDDSVPINPVPAAPGPGLGSGLIPTSKVFSEKRDPGQLISCSALVKVSKQAYRPCKKQAEFMRWVSIPGYGPKYAWSQRQVHLCFTHENAKEVFFEIK